MSRVSIVQRCAFQGFVAVLALIAERPAAAESDAYSFGSYEGTSSYHYPMGSYSAPYGFSSTAFEGAQRGRAALVEAWGNFAVRKSQAAILWQQARAFDRENDVQQTIALFDQRDIWRQARELDRKEREQRNAEGKLILAARVATEYKQAYALSSDELDLSTGMISWPAQLLVGKYECQRRRVDQLFRTLASNPDPQPELVAEIGREVDALVRELRCEIRVLPQDEYLAAQKFLRGLKYAAVYDAADKQG